MRLGISGCNRLNDLDFISPLEPAESANNRSLLAARSSPRKDGGEGFGSDTQPLSGLVRAKGHDWPSLAPTSFFHFLMPRRSLAARAGLTITTIPLCRHVGHGRRELPSHSTRLRRGRLPDSSYQRHDSTESLSSRVRDTFSHDRPGRPCPERRKQKKDKEVFGLVAATDQIRLTPWLLWAPIGA